MTKEAAGSLTDLRILILGQDSRALAHISHDIMTGLDADITVVEDAGEARELVSTQAFDAILTANTTGRLPEGLAPEAQGASVLPTPVILVGPPVPPSRVLAAIRSGAFDVLPDTVDTHDLLETICRAARVARSRSRLWNRNRRLRRVSSKLVRERRDLRRRVDLICRDVVTAYQRLAERVVTSGENVN